MKSLIAMNKPLDTSWKVLWITCCILIVSSIANAQSGRRLALVVGISGYADDIGRLPKALSDAGSVDNSLRDVGFQVTLLEDVTKQDILSSVGKFASQVDKTDVVLFYFAGHGAQEAGANYLLPVDWQTTSQVTSDGVALDYIISEIGGHGPKLKIFVIDACSDDVSTGKESGMAAIRAGRFGAGTFIEMSSAPNQPDLDGMFSPKFAAVLQEPGLTIGDVFIRVQEQVLRESQGRQDPYSTSSQTEQFYLSGPLAISDSDLLPTAQKLFNDGKFSDAFRLFSRLADHNDPLGMRVLGNMYLKGQGVELDYEQAAYWAQRAAAESDAPAMSTLGYLYQNGWGVPKDFGEAVNWYRKSAGAGYAEGMSNLGFMYQKGWGVKQDYAQAVDWYQKATYQHYGPAMSNLGFMYQNGWGVTKDYAQAVNWYRRAAEEFSPEGMRNLAFMYLQGWGVAKDYQLAMDWASKAADYGDGRAKSNIGFMYEDGLGVKPDYAQAVEWYRKGAAADDDEGMDNLGTMYENGRGVKQDYTEAADWYKKSADLGYASAMGHLGFMYQKGRGVEQDSERRSKNRPRSAAAAA